MIVYYLVGFINFFRDWFFLVCKVRKFYEFFNGFGVIIVLI